MKKLFILLLAFSWGHIQAQVQQENITFPFEGCEFKGTLYLPEGDGPHPSAVLIPGSGQNDRNGTIQLVGDLMNCLYPGLSGLTLRPYLDLASALAEGGYAVLTYDEILVSCPATQNPTFEGFWMPPLGAIDFLKNHDLVDRDKIFLIGHSEGAMLAPYIFRQKPELVAVVSLGGARTPLDSIMARQIVQFTEMCGGNMNDAQFQANQILDYYNFLRQGFTNLPDLWGATADDWKRYIQINDSVAINYNNLPVPFLMIGMSEDLNVPLSELERFKGEIDHPLADFFEVENLNHFMTTNQQPIVPTSFTDTILHWLNGAIFSSTSDEHSRIEESLFVFPNPGPGVLRVKLPNGITSQIHWRVKNIKGQFTGKKGYEYVYPGTDTIELQLEDLPTGTYILEVFSDGWRQSVKLVIER
ncbi:MAG: T9SS C-terminal target domain-containing protein [Saprospirales bacterium]|nr:MAG: T9SS C-terminal target domain-containing protein [Saprospirales bacterium]